MAYTTSCDQCGNLVERDDIVEVRLPRPSDPTDLCCIMAGCADCFRPGDPAQGATAALAYVWDAYVESDHAKARGVWGLS